MCGMMCEYVYGMNVRACDYGLCACGGEHAYMHVCDCACVGKCACAMSVRV